MTRSSSPRWTTTAASRRGSSSPTTATSSSRTIELRDDTTLDYDDLESKLSDRTRVVAFAWASNAVGTVIDAQRVCELAHEAGALAWIDAVHYAAHEPIDVRQIDADVLICSPYKFCGPHLGVAYGRAEVIERWRPYKARPAPTTPLGRRFETGTQPVRAARRASTRRSTTWTRSAASSLIVPYERSLGERFLSGISDAVTVYGLPVDGGPRADVPGQRGRRAGGGRRGAAGRAGHGRVGPRLLVLARPVPAAGLRATQAVRIGFIHYNTAEEVDALVAALNALAD